MYHRYHVSKKEAAPLGIPFSKNEVIRDDHCMNCGRCAEACVYKVHERDPADPRVMATPKHYLCKNCLRCVENCPQRALTVKYSSEYLGLGGGVWTPTRVLTIYNEAWTGKIPVFGAGYRGQFAGPGYDSMWTDMSEIVRPTRDGIHGREFISTAIDLGRRVDHLEFDKNGRLLTQMPKIVEIPIPILMDTVRMSDVTTDVYNGLAEASGVLGTYLMVPAESVESIDAAQRAALVPVFQAGKASAPSAVTNPTIVEFEHSSEWRKDRQDLKERYPGSLVGVRIVAGEGIEKTVLELATGGIDIIHLLYDEQGMEVNGRLTKDSLLSINKALANVSQREFVSIIVSGGLAAAEHVPKSLICGADAIVLERSLRVSMGCKVCATCSECLFKKQGVTQDWVKWRTVNMVSAWTDQLLEVMGAMGIREARRLRGETGRAIFYEEAEKDAFSSISGGA